MRSFRSSFVLLALLPLVGSCGGDTSGPEAPPPVASVTVSPATLDMVAGDTQQLQVTLRDADGNALSGRTVTYASSDDTVATVDASGLVTAVGKGRATLTAASEGRSGSASATVEWADFQPTSATTVDGDATYATVEVPEGVTVTVAAAATITSEGAVDIQGTVTATCHALTLSGASVSITGDVSTPAPRIRTAPARS